MSTLYLSLKREYFDAIRDGSKIEEYRLCNEYWKRRLEGRLYDVIVLKLGYPKHDDTTRLMRRAFAGFKVKTITHPHFGRSPVKVFAIDVTRRLSCDASGVDQPDGAKHG